MHSALIVIATVGVIALAPIATVPAPSTPFEVGELVLPQPGECEKQCIECALPGEHSILWNSNHNSWGANHPCAGGDCDWHDCDNFSVDTDPLQDWVRDGRYWAALADASGDELQSFLKRNPGRAFVNTERRSIQVWGCPDELVANVPVTEDQFAAVANNN